VSQYYLARGCEHAFVELLPPSHVSDALRALEGTLVDALAKASGGSSSSSRVASRVHALTREASKQRWPRAGAMLYLRHRAFAAAVRARYPGPEATSLRSHGPGSEGGDPRPAGNYTHVLVGFSCYLYFRLPRVWRRRLRF
jgi:hypothetical protein